MNVIELHIPDVKLIEPEVYYDDRGFFYESYQNDRYREQLGIKKQFVQDNFSKSKQGVIRGLHFQCNYPQGKLISVLSGEVLDIAVDMRKESPYFGKWCSTILSEKNHRQLWIPEGFAHGFLVLSKYAYFLYKCTEYYYPEFEKTVVYNDPDLGIDWGSYYNGSFQLSAKDRAGLSFYSAI